MPPFDASIFFSGSDHLVRCGRVFGLVMRPSMAAGPYGARRIASLSGLRAYRRAGRCRFARSRLFDRCPLPFRRPAHITGLARRPSDETAAGFRSSSWQIVIAQTMRAILLASATTTSMRGLRAIIRASHDPSAGPLRAAQVTTADAPMVKSRRISRWPILDVRPSRVLPPVAFCRGVRPTHAAKSRPLSNGSMMDKMRGSQSRRWRQRRG